MQSKLPESKRINSKLISGLSKDEIERVVLQYEDAKKILQKIRKEIEHDAETELLELSKRIDSGDIAVTIAQILGRRQGLLKTLTYFPEE